MSARDERGRACRHPRRRPHHRRGRPHRHALPRRLRRRRHQGGGARRRPAAFARRPVEQRRAVRQVHALQPQQALARPRPQARGGPRRAASAARDRGRLHRQYTAGGVGTARPRRRGVAQPASAADPVQPHGVRARRAVSRPPRLRHHHPGPVGGDRLQRPGARRAALRADGVRRSYRRADRHPMHSRRAVCAREEPAKARRSRCRCSRTSPPSCSPSTWAT